MKVVVYTPGYSPKLTGVMQALAEGIPGAVIRDQADYEPADVACIFGGVKNVYRPTHSKAAIMARHRGRSLLMVESAFLRRGEYYQVACGGPAGHGDFRTGPGLPLDRWYRIGVDVRPWSDRPDGTIVVCGQLPRDVQVQDVDHVGWCRKTVARCEALAPGRVRFRPHPKVDDAGVYGVDRWIMDERPLPEALADARCVVTWNSTTAVETVIAGVPTVAQDRGSMAWPVTSRGPEQLVRPSRRDWLAALGYSQWTLDEMREGAPWRWLTRE